MALPPISPISVGGVPGIGAGQFAPGAGATAPTAGAAASESSFGDMLTNALDTVSESHKTADGLALQAATGDLNAVHDYTIAATEAQLMTQLTVEIRNRAVDAFNEIMRMQV